MRALIIIVLTALALMDMADAHGQGKRYCQKNDGTVIIVAPPHLCPPGTWEIR